MKKTNPLDIFYNLINESYTIIWKENDIDTLKPFNSAVKALTKKDDKYGAGACLDELGNVLKAMKRTGKLMEQYTLFEELLNALIEADKELNS